MTTRLFLIVFDREANTSSLDDLGNNLTTAMEIFAARERELAERPDLEVVLLGSPSLEALRRTHSSYFGATDGLRPVLARDKR